MKMATVSDKENQGMYCSPFKFIFLFVLHFIMGNEMLNVEYMVWEKSPFNLFYTLNSLSNNTTSSTFEIKWYTILHGKMRFVGDDGFNLP